MKKWFVAFLLFALALVDTSCVVRVKERSRPLPLPAHGVVVN